MNTQFRFTTTSDFGAVLVATTPVLHDAYASADAIMDWVHENAQALLESTRGEEIAENGFFVATETWSCSHGAITTLTSPNNEAFVGLDMSVTRDSAISLHMNWCTGKSDDGWSHFGTSVRLFEVIVRLLPWPLSDVDLSSPIFMKRRLV